MNDEPYNPPSEDWMQTFTGGAFFPYAARVEDINIVDIAHSLAFQCRYNGHTKYFYSVAEHCVLISYAVPEEDALWGLLHDAPEAYISDMIRPLKKKMPEFRELDEHIMTLICEKFGLPLEMPESIKEADNRIIENERLALLSEPPLPWTVLHGALPNVAIQAWTPEEAEIRYLARFQNLIRDRIVKEAKGLEEASKEKNV